MIQALPVEILLNIAKQVHFSTLITELMHVSKFVRGLLTAYPHVIVKSLRSTFGVNANILAANILLASQSNDSMGCYKLTAVVKAL